MTEEIKIDEKFISAYDTYNQQLEQVYKTDPRFRRDEKSGDSASPSISNTATAALCKNDDRGFRYVTSTALIACTTAMLFFMYTDRSAMSR